MGINRNKSTGLLSRISRKFGDLSLQVKLLTALLVGIGLAILLAILLVSNVIRQFESRVSETELVVESQLAAIHFAQQEKIMQEIAVSIATNEILGTAVAIGDLSILDSVVSTFQVQHGLDHIAIINADNDFLYDQTLSGGSLLTDLLGEALSNNQTTTLLFTEEGWLLTAVVPISDPIGVIGAVSIGKLLDQELLSEINVNRVRPILHIHGPDGTVLASSANVNDNLKDSVDLSLWQKAMGGQTGQAIGNNNDAAFRVIYTPLQIKENIVAVLSVEVSTNDIRTLQRQLNSQTLVVLSGVGIVTAGFIYVLMRFFITNPLTVLGQAAKDIGAGNLDTPLPPASNDEIGQLTQSFGLMVAQLRELLATLEQRIKVRTSDLANANQQLQQAKESAEAANQAKDDFLAIISHELRTPLHAILAYADMIQLGVYGPVNEKQDIRLQRIITNSNKLASLIASLLEQAQMQSSQVNLKLADFAPSELIDYLDSALSTRAKSKGLIFKRYVEDDVPALVHGDVQRLQDILGNLVGNAIKFTDEGFITIRIFLVDNDHWGLQVIDSGAGISEEDQVRIFQPFKQIQDAITRAYGGIGLGLSIVQNLTNLMGGEILLESKEGDGSIFTIKLPLSPAQEQTV